ncbi:hypothetical protein [Geodermatophilus sp. CPCC 206100]|uniref:hypothetical protein n=1 Tax=Geodermatophilus sp. CPCC 206100 TaxID=3020054 RepID=UPI003AFFAE1D
MSVDLSAAADFMAASARLLDRRRFDVLFAAGDGDRAAAADAVLAAVEAYRNPDGGYGWGLEPDLRSRTSQPGGALHALEAMVDAAPTTTPRARELCDWLAAVTLPDGGLPFALPVPDPAACAPFWADADATTSSLQITAVVAAVAHRVAAYDPPAAGPPGLATATAFCLRAVRALGPEPHALELAFAVGLLDRVAGTDPEAGELLAGLRRHVPPSGLVHVGGGAEEEFMRALDFAPEPDRPARALVRPEAVERELARLAGQQQDDGGWAVDFASYSPAAALEWRGHRTVEALGILRANGVL